MRRLPASLAAAGAVVMMLGTAAAAADANAKPHHGDWSGTEVTDTTPQPVSFTVGHKGTAVTDFAGEAIVRAGCKNHIVGFSAPVGPMTVDQGRFHGVETNYPQQGVRVSVTGTFTSPTSARGHIKIQLKKIAGCDATRHWTAKRHK